MAMNEGFFEKWYEGFACNVQEKITLFHGDSVLVCFQQGKSNV